MKIFLGIIITLLLFGMYDSKTDEERKVYKATFIISMVAFVVVTIAEKAVALWL